jgi:hypothetical protein
MNTQHTPAPWIHSRGKTDDWGCIRDADGRLVAKCALSIDDDTIIHRRNGTDPTEANARLIAAAPELLYALQQADECLEDMNYGMDGYIRTLIGNAIAKATGKETQ